MSSLSSQIWLIPPVDGIFHPMFLFAVNFCHFAKNFFFKKNKNYSLFLKNYQKGQKNSKHLPKIIPIGYNMKRWYIRFYILTLS